MERNRWRGWPGNIQDPDEFVGHHISRYRGQLSRNEREDLHAEGIALLCELWIQYDPTKDKMPGGSTGGFFGYAYYLLPRRLSDAVHEARENRIRRQLPDGSREYEYADLPKSLEGEPKPGPTRRRRPNALSVHTLTTRETDAEIPDPAVPAAARSLAFGFAASAVARGGPPSGAVASIVGMLAPADAERWRALARAWDLGYGSPAAAVGTSVKPRSSATPAFGELAHLAGCRVGEANSTWTAAGSVMFELTQIAKLTTSGGIGPDDIFPIRRGPSDRDEHGT